MNFIILLTEIAKLLDRYQTGNDKDQEEILNDVWCKIILDGHKFYYDGVEFVEEK